MALIIYRAFSSNFYLKSTKIIEVALIYYDVELPLVTRKEWKKKQSVTEHRCEIVVLKCPYVGWEAADLWCAFRIILRLWGVKGK